MTKHTQKVETPTPIQDTENRRVHGQGLACKMVHDDHVAEVTRLRQRQEAYEASLPKDQQAALREIAKAGSRDLRDVWDNECAARLAYVIIFELADKINADLDLQDALRWLSRIGLEAVDRVEADMKHVHSIARQFQKVHTVYRA
ncbi:MAG: hypothetical protein AAGK00_18275 [Pseudomonadota bacterium]